MDALATYEQRFGGVRRQFVLLPEHLLVHGRRFGSSFDLRYDLPSLSTHFDRARVIAPLFYGGLTLISTALVGIIFLAFDGGLMWLASIVLGAIALVGIACVIFRLRPLRVFMFKFKDGSYAFEIVGAGKDSLHVEQFALTVAEQIGKARTGASNLQGTNRESR
jgi:hypothetical protein